MYEGTEIFTIQLDTQNSAGKNKIKICNPSTTIGQIIDEGT